MCRSDPHTPVVSTRTTASSGAWGSGSGRSSTRTSPGAWKVTASIPASYRVGADVGRDPHHRLLVGHRAGDGRAPGRGRAYRLRDRAAVGVDRRPGGGRV